MLENEKKVFLFKGTPTLTPGIAHVLASWARSGNVPLGKATFHSLCLFVCPHLSFSLNLSYLVLRLLVRACRQEELHGGGVTFLRGLNESRVAKHLHMRGKG